MARPEAFQIRVTKTENLGDRLVVTFESDIDPQMLMRALESAVRIAPAQPRPGKILDLFAGLPLVRSVVRDQLADHAHRAWSGWMAWQFSLLVAQEDGSLVIPQHLVERWSRQMTTPYAALHSDERASDLAEADKMLAIVERMGVRAGKFDKVTAPE